MSKKRTFNYFYIYEMNVIIQMCLNYISNSHMVGVAKCKTISEQPLVRNAMPN